ncbi:MAG: hypothetical protein A2847_01765 [Candidatus Sungbacteria bacterium RIFCSPHIGHO2_01_FULL_50_25]|uniref:Amino acid transporter transmembrane domain-containing protein n=1 Tax=Candidatus Sungbacteria bacterium RIFCSPHIGHO2_01_FULL_50_25 TaxID=1802265 RepID=A0A1G2KBX7_9BACT|nr:MAG: hypothetical protein A2847_01765 [Candidatus Sungbacteria bacterium RIFCSPHIGHO2_01_FULL_50_25]
MSFLRLCGGILMLAGMIIGAGMFAIPFSFAHAGVLLGTAELIVLTAAVILFHLSYAEVVSKTGEAHRLPGYAGMYLGKWAEYIALGSIAASAIGTLLVYLLLGSRFLGDALRAGAWIFAPTGAMSFDVYLVFFLAGIGALITFFPIRSEAAINAILTAFLILFIGFLVYLLFPLANVAEFQGWTTGNFFIPYGILLFALWGGVLIPDVVTFLGNDERRVKIAVVAGTLLPALVYFFFSLAVVGVSGALTSREALQGLLGAVDEEVIVLGAVVGLLAVFTSFVALQKTFQMMLELDFGVPRLWAWIGANSVPLAFYLFGFTDFIVMIAIVGAIAIGVDAALILCMHYVMKTRRGERIAWYGLLARAVLLCVVVGGIGYHLLLMGR